MSGYNKFDAEIYSEEIQLVSETEYDEVMQAIAEESDWQGYEEFSQELESENFTVREGKVEHKPQPPSNRCMGFEL